MDFSGLVVLIVGASSDIGGCLASILNEYSGHIKVHVVPFTKIQEEIYKKVPHTYMITIMRRMMYRIALKVCQKNNLN